MRAVVNGDDASAWTTLLAVLEALVRRNKVLPKVF